MTQREALRILKMGFNSYITGPAGSGKTYLLNQDISYLRSQGVNVGMTASTGIAATNLGGRTIHSWAGIGINTSLSEEELKNLKKRQELEKRIQETDVLIIDEISMLDARRFDLVDKVLRVLRESKKPFGGIQVVLCGDFFQLPPVSQAGKPKAQFAYRAASWKKLDLQICYLHEQHRQMDGDHLSVLKAIRGDHVSEETLEFLRWRHRATIPGITRLTRLYTHNVDVDAINAEELTKISGASVCFVMETEGVPALVEELKRGCLAPEELYLKEGAFVMFVKNDFDKGYVNGTLGSVVGFKDSSYPVVETLQGEEIVATPESWKIEEGSGVAAKITQVPLRLAWAITVHKSQGMTLDAAEIDLSKAFEEGMGYVALSRVRTLEGIRLLGWNPTALKINKEVCAFDREFLEQSAKVQKKLRKISRDLIETRELEFLRSCGVR